MPASPTARTLDLLRKEGWQAQVVEKWNPHSKTRLDLFGGIDVLACRVGPRGVWADPFFDKLPDHGILGIQATSGSNHSSRKAKLLKEPKIATWLGCGGRLEIWSWSKKGPRGKRKVWEVRREALKLGDFIGAD